MADYHCFELGFPDVDLDSFYPEADKCESFHHTHLYYKKDDIEIRIFYKYQEAFGEKLSEWATTIDWKKFGSFIRTKKEEKNPRVQRFDFTDASLIQLGSGTDHYEGDHAYITVFLDIFKTYWFPQKKKVNTAEFFLNDAGFNVVKDYYSILSGQTGLFTINRYPQMDCFYKLEDSWFRPEYDFKTSDFRDNNEAKISKEPKIKFYYSNQISERKVMLYADVVRIVASFYFHSEIDFIFARIFLKASTITIKRTKKTGYKDEVGTFRAFKNYWDFHELMISDWQKCALKNYNKLKKVVELFVQSVAIEGNSGFLTSYNIIEICKSGISEENERFSVNSEIDMEKVYKEVAEKMKATIIPTEQHDFMTRWEHVKGLLVHKPMKSALRLFLESQNIHPDILPIPLKRLTSIRNDITHGSSNSVNQNELDKANALLYRIAGILILNLLGINQWELDINIK